MFNVRTPATNVTMQFSGVLRGAGALSLVSGRFTVAHTTGGVSGFFAGLPEGAPLAVWPNIFTITYAANGGNDIVLTAPEPSVALSVLAGMAGLAGLRRRRTREP